VSPNIVKTKHQMYALWKAGAFGNKVRHWDSLDDFLLSGYTGRCGFRSTKVGSSHMGVFPNPKELLRAIPVTDEKLVISEGTHDELLLIQGELTRDGSGVYLYYSTAKLVMRKALAEDPMHATGLKVHTILRYFCDPASYEDLMLLLDMYPGHVVEFSTFKTNLGVVPARNTVIWEVRNY